MKSNTFGELFSVTTFGESHGRAIGCVIDGCPSLLDLDIEHIQRFLSRRRPGQSKITTNRNETDTLEILSGLDIETGKTLGTPICIVVHNKDQKSSAYESWHHIFRPGHADYSYEEKYGIRAWQGGGRSSARETIGRVAAGAIAEQLLLKEFPNLEITAWVEEIENISCKDSIDKDSITRDELDKNIVRCPDEKSAKLMEEAIISAKKDGDSLGGTIRLYIKGVPAGLGNPIFSKLEAMISYAMMSIPACKGIENGKGFEATTLRGSQYNDEFYLDNKEIKTKTNNSGGIQGGITNGMPIEFRLSFRPTPTVSVKQNSVNDQGEEEILQARGRHDPCVLPRAVPIIEAMAALTLLDAFMMQRAQRG